MGRFYPPPFPLPVHQNAPLHEAASYLSPAHLDTKGQQQATSPSVKNVVVLA